MAVKWAVANGNWSDGTTWNDGVVPTADDDVYLDGHNISMANTSIVAKTISNGVNPNTNLSGGFILFTSGAIISANIYCYISNIIQCNNTNHIYFTLNGDLYMYSANNYAIILTAGANGYLHFTHNGNAYIYDGGYVRGIANVNTAISVVINGNLTSTSTESVFYNLGYSVFNGSFTINGDFTCFGQILYSATTSSAISSISGTLTLTGNIAAQNRILMRVGKIHYSTYFPFMPSWITPYDADNFEIKYVGAVPDQNYYVIVGQGQLQATYPAESNVLQGVTYGEMGELEGSYTTDYPQEANVMQGVTYDNGNKTGTLAPVVLGDYPDVDKVLIGTIFDYGNKVGTLEPTADYPAEADVKEGVVYDYGQKEGTLSVSADYPPESVVMQGVEYAFGEMVGTMDVSVQVGCVTKEDVREGVALLGMGEVGTLVVPSADDVREGVVFDNGTIGTLIVQGGGDRLRIADFGYYTNAQSDTYIVDITDADKPKFASAEERILIEMFPTLDLDNIPEMYFDDLFVKYLKYRLIVEYYRTAGINSTFTPSEPTTEIVNYRNVTCEVWLNSANTYLNAWNKKFGLNKPPQKVRL